MAQSLAEDSAPWIALLHRAEMSTPTSAIARTAAGLISFAGGGAGGADFDAVAHESNSLSFIGLICVTFA